MRTLLGRSVAAHYIGDERLVRPLVAVVLDEVRPWCEVRDRERGRVLVGGRDGRRNADPAQRLQQGLVGRQAVRQGLDLGFV